MLRFLIILALLTAVGEPPIASAQGPQPQPQQERTRDEGERETSESARVGELALQAKKKPKPPAIGKVILLFPTDLTAAEIRDQPELPTVTAEITSGKRVYGAAKISSTEDWIVATSGGVEIDLSRDVPILDSEQLRLHLIDESEEPPIWSGDELNMHVVTTRGFELIWLVSAKPTTSAAQQAEGKFKWKFPDPKRFPPPEPDKEPPLIAVHVRGESESLTAEAMPEANLEVLWYGGQGDERWSADQPAAIVQRFQLDTAWKWKIFFSEGFDVDLSPIQGSYRNLTEGMTESLAVRLYPSLQGRPTGVPPDQLADLAADDPRRTATEALASVILRVESIANDNLRTLLAEPDRGTTIAEFLTARRQAIDNKLDEIPTVDELEPGDEPEPADEAELEPGDAAEDDREANESAAILREKLRALSKRQRQLRFLADPRSFGRYWMPTRIIP